MKKSPKLSLQDLATEAAQPVRHCKTCGNPQVRADVVEWLNLMIQKGRPANLRKLVGWLAENRKFTIHVGSLRHHCQDHEPELWERVCQAGH